MTSEEERKAGYSKALLPLVLAFSKSLRANPHIVPVDIQGCPWESGVVFILRKVVVVLVHSFLFVN